MANSLQADLQAAIRAVTGTAGDWNADFHAYATLKGVPMNSLNARILGCAQLIDPTISNAGAALNYFLKNPSAISGGQPLRVVTAQNRVYNASESRGTTEAIFRWAHFIGSGDVSELRPMIVGGWVETQGSGYLAMATAFIITDASMEMDSGAGSGISVPITFGGQRSIVINPGDTEVFADTILPAAFGLTAFPRGKKIWTKTKVNVAQTTHQIPLATRRLVSEQTNSQAFWYDPALSVFSSTDTPGPYTKLSGNNAEQRQTGFCPWLIGKFVTGDPKTLGGIGDSILQDTADSVTANQNVGLGWFQRLMADADGVSNIWASFNCGVFNDFVAQQILNPRLLALMKYAKYGLEEGGTNDLGAIGAGNVATIFANKQTLWNSMRANGMQQIACTRLLPRTNNLNTIPNTNWGVLEKSYQLGESCLGVVSSSGATGTINTLLDTLNFRQGADNTLLPYYLALLVTYTVEGTHPTALGVQAILGDYRPWWDSLS